MKLSCQSFSCVRIAETSSTSNTLTTGPEAECVSAMVVCMKNERIYSRLERGVVLVVQHDSEDNICGRALWACYSYVRAIADWSSTEFQAGYHRLNAENLSTVEFTTTFTRAWVA